MTSPTAVTNTSKICLTKLDTSARDVSGQGGSEHVVSAGFANDGRAPTLRVIGTAKAFASAGLEHGPSKLIAEPTLPRSVDAE